MMFFSVNFNDGCHVFGARDTATELHGVRHSALAATALWGGVLRQPRSFRLTVDQ